MKKSREISANEEKIINLLNESKKAKDWGFELINERKSGLIIATILIHSKDYVKQNDGDYADQLDKFAAGLSLTAIQTQYGYDAAFKDEAVADAAYNRYTYNKRNTVANYQKAWTDKKNEVRSGTGTTVTPFAAGTDVSTPPTAVPPGNERRFRTKAQFLKDMTAVTTEASEELLGIADVHSSTDTSGIKPDLTFELVAGGHPQAKYTKGKFDKIQLKVDRGDAAGMVWLAEPTNITYTDNGGLPASGKAEVWKYIAIYMLNDVFIGDWCDAVSVTVHGV
jgi:hypothetical protein